MEVGKSVKFEVKKLVNAYTLTVDDNPATLAFFKGSREMTEFIRKTVDPVIATRTRKVVQSSHNMEIEPDQQDTGH